MKIALKSNLLDEVIKTMQHVNESGYIFSWMHLIWQHVLIKCGVVGFHQYHRVTVYWSMLADLSFHSQCSGFLKDFHTNLDCLNLD